MRGQIDDDTARTLPKGKVLWDYLLPGFGAPRTESEESRAVASNFILAWDNVSQLDGRMSDRLCRLSTGGASPLYKGHLVRPCQSNLRPVILNGIAGFVRRPDLADRALFVPLGTLPDGEKTEEAELATRFIQVWPTVLGALLDGVAAGLTTGQRGSVGNVGRMADMVKFVTKCEPALWGKPRFVDAYAASNMRAAEILAEADPVVSAIVAYLDHQGFFKGTATELLMALKKSVSAQIGRTRLPGGPSPLSEALTRAEPVLERLGIAIIRDRVGAAGSRRIEIKRIEPRPPAAVRKRPQSGRLPSENRSSQLSLALTDDTDGNQSAF